MNVFCYMFNTYTHTQSELFLFIHPLWVKTTWLLSLIDCRKTIAWLPLVSTDYQRPGLEHRCTLISLARYKLAEFASNYLEMLQLLRMTHQNKMILALEFLLWQQGYLCLIELRCITMLIHMTLGNGLAWEQFNYTSQYIGYYIDWLCKLFHIYVVLWYVKFIHWCDSIYRIILLGTTLLMLFSLPKGWISFLIRHLQYYLCTLFNSSSSWSSCGKMDMVVDL